MSVVCSMTLPRTHQSKAHVDRRRGIWAAVQADNRFKSTERERRHRARDEVSLTRNTSHMQVV